MRRLAPHVPVLLPGLASVGLMLTWAAHDGGYDSDTWYWGALVSLALLAAVVVGLGDLRPRMSRPSTFALALFVLYVAWSYLSISWAASPGDALQGSNRALLYLLVFALLTALPWNPNAALFALMAFAVGVGLIGLVLMFRIAFGHDASGLFMGGRLAAPSGYFNSTAALFTADAFVAIALATRRQLPALLRGFLLALASVGLDLAVLAQSRGWLFTLPLVAIVTLVLLKDRLRVAAAGVIVAAATLAPLRGLLHLYQSSQASGTAAASAARPALVSCAVALVAGTLIAWSETRLRPTPLSMARRRVIGTAAAVIAVAAVGLAGVVATHGHPFRFISRQWQGFSHPQTTSTGSHFTDVGSGRYDFWRVSLDALLAHPVGGLGQDNFADYYITHRRTSEEPEWTHSLELRLLAHTGSVGFALFAAFMVAAVAAALRGRRDRNALTQAVAGVALIPLVVWLIHGSVDWFWEMPALSGSALGFLGMAGALGRPGEGELAVRRATRKVPRAFVGATGAVALVAAVIVLGFPYASVREISVASDIRQTDAAQALHDLSIAADLNPLSSDPGRVGGTIALQSGRYADAESRFGQAISREPGGWYAWLGQGLAASALGDRTRAHRDYQVAASIDSQESAVAQALRRVYSAHPLTPAQALQMLALAE